MLPAGFEPTIPASERPQTHILGRAATGISAIDKCEKVFGSYTLLYCNVVSSPGLKLRTHLTL